jgi:hypothetical protein
MIPSRRVLFYHDNNPWYATCWSIHFPGTTIYIYGIAYQQAESKTAAKIIEKDLISCELYKALIQRSQLTKANELELLLYDRTLLPIVKSYLDYENVIPGL